MHRGPLYADDYRPQLSGHETFPLRYGWLKKAFDAVQESESCLETKSIFLSEDAGARFGIGKNMVSSMRHWASVTDVVRDTSREGRIVTETTNFGCLLFDDESGLDPYMEDPTTLWVIHWKLSSRPQKTTWFWAFNHYPATYFGRDQLVNGLCGLAKDRSWSRASMTTIRNDVACFVRTYVRQSIRKHGSYEDSLESPLAELGLIKSNGKRDNFQFVRGRKRTLGAGVFCWAVTEFWSKFSPEAQTLSLESLMYAPGSPGRVFLLDENDMVGRLAKIEETSKGLYRWSESAGLKQLTRTCDLNVKKAHRFIKIDYRRKGRSGAV